MTNASFDENHGSGEQAPRAAGREVCAAPALQDTLVPVGFSGEAGLRLLFPIPAGSSSARFPRSLLLPPLHQPQASPGRAVDGCKQKPGVPVTCMNTAIQIIPECKAGILINISACECGHCSCGGPGRRTNRPARDMRIADPRLLGRLTPALESLLSFSTEVRGFP